MPLNVGGGDSLFFKTGIDTTGLKKGAAESKGIIAKLIKSISAFDLYAAVTVGLGLKTKNLVKEMITLAARYETMGIVMRTVADTAGYTAVQMLDYQKALEKTGISMLSSRQALTQMLQAHIDLNKATELGRIAQDAAVIANINSSEAFERMINGIQRGEIEILKTMGINVQFEQGYEKLAKTLGKNSKELTELEKVQSRINTVMERSVDIAGTYEAAMDTAGKQALSLERYFENLKVTLGQLFQPAYSVMVSGLTFSLKELLYILDKLGLVKDVVASSYDVMASSGKQYIALLEREKNSIDSLAEELDTLSKIKNPTIEESRKLTETEEKLAIAIGVDVSNALGSATELLDLYNESKIKSVEIDEQILQMTLEVAEAELASMEIRKEQLALGKAEVNIKQKSIAGERIRTSQKITAGVLGITGRTDIGLTKGGTYLNIETEVRKEITALKDEGIVIDGLERRLIDLNVQKFSGVDKSIEEREILKEILDKSTELKQLDLDALSVDTQRLVEMKALNLEIETQKNLVESLRKGIIPEVVTAPIVDLKALKKAQEEYEKWRADLREKYVEDSNEQYQQEYKDWKEIEDSRNEEAIKLEEILQGEKDKIRAAGENKLLDNLLKDYRNYNKKQLADYRKTIEEQLKLATNNAVTEKMLREELRDIDKEADDDRIKSIKDIGDALNELGNLAGIFDSKLGDTIKGVSKIADAYAKMKDATKGSYGELAGAFGVAGAGISFIESFIQAFQKVDMTGEKQIAQMAELNRLTEKQIDALRRFNGDEALQGMVDLFKTLNNEIDTNVKSLLSLEVENLTGRNDKRALVEIFPEMIDADIEDVKEFLLSLNKTFGADGLVYLLTDKQRENIKALVGDITDAQGVLLDYAAEYNEMLTGTTADSIADSIADGFASGLRSADDFSVTFEDMMRKAIMNSFKAMIETKYINAFYAKFIELSENEVVYKGGELTPGEVNILWDSWDTMMAGVGEAYNFMEDRLRLSGFDLTKLPDADTASQTGIAGAIKGITEQTAEILEGQLNAMRISLLNLDSIADNTLRTANNTELLREINTKFTTQNSLLRSMGAIG